MLLRFQQMQPLTRATFSLHDIFEAEDMHCVSETSLIVKSERVWPKLYCQPLLKRCCPEQGSEGVDGQGDCVGMGCGILAAFVVDVAFGCSGAVRVQA